jgi:cytoskeletal protein CcmA (bactofilin family)
MFHRVKSDQDDRNPAQERTIERTVAPAAAPRAEQQAPEKPRAPEQASRVSETRQQPQQPEKRFMAPRDERREDEQPAEQEQARSLNIPGGYSATQTRSTPGAYPGAYSGYKPVGANAATLTIGSGITLSGEIEACDHLVVEGNVEAALKGAKLLDVAESGTFFGTVEIERATIAGRFEGDLTVNGRLTVRSTGQISGSIAYRELEIEAGAVLDGRILPLKSTQQDRQTPTVQAKSKDAAAAIAKAREFRAQKDAQDAANADEGLFSKASG